MPATKSSSVKFYESNGPGEKTLMGTVSLTDDEVIFEPADSEYEPFFEKLAKHKVMTTINGKTMMVPPEDTETWFQALPDEFKSGYLWAERDGPVEEIEDDD